MSDRYHHFIKAMTDAIGYAPDCIEPGRIQRFATSSNKASKPGYCKLWPDEESGFFGDFRTGAFEMWSAHSRASMTPVERHRHDQQVAQAKAERDKQQAQRWLKNRDRIRDAWLSACNLKMGDPVTLYLKRRGLVGLRNFPTVLRYHRALPYWHEGQVIGTYPAMLARFHATDGRCVALHQTYLTQDGCKANIPTPKKMSPTSGHLMGGCIPLAQPVDCALGIAEGIETALCASAGSGVPVVAAYSASCLAGFVLPHGLKRLVIFGDNDDSGTGQSAAEKLACRARAAGIAVTVAVPKTPNTDWADVWARRDEMRVDAVAESLESSYMEWEQA